MTDGATADGTATDGENGEYRGILGAFPYAFRASESLLFKSYAAIGGALAAIVVVLFVSAVVVLLGKTASAAGGVFTFSRALYFVLMLSVLAPLVGPVLSVARRHRREGSSVAYDRAVAAGGYLFVAALYVGLIISTPAEQRESTDGPLGPALEALYSLPREAGAVPPMLAIVGLYLIHRRFR